MEPIQLAANAPGGNSKGCGIYMILCRANGRGYVGQAQVISRRLAAHRTSLRGGKHYNVHLQRAWNAHGEAAFDFLELENCPEEMLDEREGFYAASIDAGLIFNLKECGDSYPRTEEHRRNLATARRAWVTSPEHMAKLQAGLAEYFASGEHREAYTPEVRAKISAARQGYEPTEAQRAALLAFSAKPKSEGHRRKISEAQKGKPRNPESIAKMTATIQANPRPAWNKGRPLSEAHKQSLRDAKRKIREGKETL